MEMIKLCNVYKAYLARPDVKDACSSKIYSGFRKIEAVARATCTTSDFYTVDLDKFYSEAPANLKMFKNATVQKVLKNYQRDYSGFSEEAITLDVYNNTIVFLTFLRLAAFHKSVTELEPTATVATTGVSKTVFNRIKTVQDIIDIDDADIKQKNPKKADLLYIEMGLKRMISMEVKSDDWT